MSTRRGSETVKLDPRPRRRPRLWRNASESDDGTLFVASMPLEPFFADATDVRLDEPFAAAPPEAKARWLKAFMAEARAPPRDDARSARDAARLARAATHSDACFVRSAIKLVAEERHRGLLAAIATTAPFDSADNLSRLLADTLALACEACELSRTPRCLHGRDAALVETLLVAGARASKPKDGRMDRVWRYDGFCADVALRMVAAGCDPNSRGGRPLASALEGGADADTLRALVSAGARPAVWPPAWLRVAPGEVRRFAAAGAPLGRFVGPDGRPRLAFLDALDRGDSGTVAEFLECGVDATRRFDVRGVGDRLNALEFAAARGHAATVRVLTAAGCAVDKRVLLRWARRARAEATSGAWPFPCPLEASAVTATLREIVVRGDAGDFEGLRRACSAEPAAFRGALGACALPVVAAIRRGAAGRRIADAAIDAGVLDARPDSAPGMLRAACDVGDAELVLRLASLGPPRDVFASLESTVAIPDRADAIDALLRCSGVDPRVEFGVDLDQDRLASLALAAFRTRDGENAATLLALLDDASLAALRTIDADASTPNPPGGAARAEIGTTLWRLAASVASERGGDDDGARRRHASRVARLDGVLARFARAEDDVSTRVSLLRISADAGRFELAARVIRESPARVSSAEARLSTLSFFRAAAKSSAFRERRRDAALDDAVRAILDRLSAARAERRDEERADEDAAADRGAIFAAAAASGFDDLDSLRSIVALDGLAPDAWLAVASAPGDNVAALMACSPPDADAGTAALVAAMAIGNAACARFLARHAWRDDGRVSWRDVGARFLWDATVTSTRPMEAERRVLTDADAADVASDRWARLVEHPGFALGFALRREPEGRRASVELARTVPAERRACPICLSVEDADTPIEIVRPCGHPLCAHCAARLMRERPPVGERCPLCREPIVFLELAPRPAPVAPTAEAALARAVIAPEPETDAVGRDGAVAETKKMPFCA